LLGSFSSAGKFASDISRSVASSAADHLAVTAE
jgi:hypothetical protein